ncbi:hypothetical protein [Anabaena sp. FACHB-1237]|nr:hypothetical protein [Anabaena sp. FACHB-1237]
MLDFQSLDDLITWLDGVENENED